MTLTPHPYGLMQASEVASPFVLNEAVVFVADGVPAIQYYTVDHDAGTEALQVSFSQSDVRSLATDGDLLFVGKTAGVMHVYQWTGTTFHRVWTGSSGAALDVGGLAIARGNGLYLQAARNINPGEGIQSLSYQDAYPWELGATRDEWTDPLAWWENIMDFRIANAGTNEYGDTLVGAPYWADDLLVSFTYSGNTETVHDTQAVTLGVQQCIGWDRDTGLIVAAERGTTSVEVFQLNMSTRALSLIGTGSTTGNVLALCVCNGFVVTLEDATPDIIRTYSVSGSTLSLVDSLNAIASGGISSIAVTSPASNRVYIAVKTASTSDLYIYDVDVAGNVTWVNTINTNIGTTSKGLSTLAFWPVALTSLGSDIVWDAEPITCVDINHDGDAYNNLYFYGNSSVSTWARAGYTAWTGALYVVPHISSDFSTGEYLLSYAVVSTVSGSGQINVNYSPGTPGTWYELYNCDVRLEDLTNDGVFEHQVIDITIAQDDGFGAPVGGTSKTKRVTFITYGGSGTTRIAYDTFTGTNGTDLTAHTMNVGSGWTSWVGALNLLSGTAVAPSGTDSQYVFDAGVADCGYYAEVIFNAQSAGFIFRGQDSSNYWLLKFTNDTLNPTMEIIEVNSGTPTTRASKTFYGEGPLASTVSRSVSIVCDGDEIWCRALHTYNGNPLWELTYTSSSMNTETLFGVRTYGTLAKFDKLWVSDIEIGVIT